MSSILPEDNDYTKSKSFKVSFFKLRFVGRNLLKHICYPVDYWITTECNVKKIKKERNSSNGVKENNNNETQWHKTPKI